MDLSDRLTSLLVTKGITAYRLRKDLKLGNSVIASWLERSTYPDGKTLIRLADYLSVSIDYLVGRSDIPERR